MHSEIESDDEFNPLIAPAPHKMALFDDDDIIAMAANVGSSENRKAMFNRIKQTSRTRRVVPPPRREDLHEIFDALKLEMPNFTEVIEHLRKQAVLRNRAKVPIMGSQPILLTGDPGIGKTFFAQALAESERLAQEFHLIDAATISAAFILIGGSSMWSESTFGRIFGCLLSGKTINPIVLIDECDKLSKGQYPPENALFNLLNPAQSRKFVDESVAPMAIDASRIMYILTANDTSSMHPAILDRCLVFHIEKPTKIQAIDVAKSVWASIRKTESWAKSFGEQLSDNVLLALSDQTPRAMKKSLENAMATCALRDDGGEILPEDVAEHKPATTRRIGF